MYLRNKKTGEVVDWSFVGPTAIKEYEGKDVLLERERYESIEEFISEWEDYVPKEPLIKDEKIRRAVRAWADAVGTECIEITHSRSHFIRFMSYLADDDELCISREIGQIFDEKLYTIAELCGEEE